MARTKRNTRAANQDRDAAAVGEGSTSQAPIVNARTPTQKLINDTLVELLTFNPRNQDRVKAAIGRLLHARTLAESAVEAATESAVVELRKLSNEEPEGSTAERLLAKRALARWYSVAGQDKRGLALERYRDCHQLIWRLEQGEVSVELAAYIAHLRDVLPKERDECLVPAWPNKM